MQFLLADILVWRKSEDSVRIISETLTLVEGQELEVSALVVLKGNLKLSERSFLLLIGLKRLDASIILPDETLELSGSVSQLRGSLRKDLVRVGLVHIVSLGLASLVKLVSLYE